MTVSAPDLTFLDLRFDARPGTSTAGISRYIRDFVTPMVELEHDDVGLATVHAWVRREILDDAAPIFGSSGSYIPQQTGFLRMTVLAVVLAPVRGETLPAPRLQLRLAASHRRKGIQRLHLPTFRARSHERERADTRAPRE